MWAHEQQPTCDVRDGSLILPMGAVVTLHPRMYCYCRGWTAIGRAIPEILFTALHRNMHAMHCSVIQFSAIQCNLVQCSAVTCSDLHCSSFQCRTLHCTALHCDVVHCTALQCSAVQCDRRGGAGDTQMTDQGGGEDTLLHCIVVNCTALYCG